MTLTQNSSTLPVVKQRLPWGALLALAAAGFLAIFTETIPAGLLPQLAMGLTITEAAAGQLVTLYAVGSLLAAIPLVTATRSLDRRRVLVAAVLTLAVCNALTALVPMFSVILVFRFVAGAAAALIWGVIAGYARGLVAPELQGRALAVTGIGQPIALAAGLPLGALLGSLVSWRIVFVMIVIASVLLLLWILVSLPSFAGSASTNRVPLRKAVSLPGVRPVLWVLFLVVLAHNVLYTYIAPVLAPTGLRLDLGLAMFGIAAIASVALTGTLIDRYPRALTIGALLLILVAALSLALPGWIGMLAVAVAVLVWGFGFGGIPSLLQTALADCAGDQVDAAQAVLVTVFNAAVAVGGLVGGLILAAAFPVGALGGTASLLTLAAMVIVLSHRAAFPARRSVTPSPLQ